MKHQLILLIQILGDQTDHETSDDTINSRYEVTMKHHLSDRINITLNLGILCSTLVVDNDNKVFDVNTCVYHLCQDLVFG